jgi:hypothetical protein
MSWEYLVSLDIGSIHDYIFGTNKLREIRGASILLDKLNRELPLEAINNVSRYGNQNKDWKAVVLGGGNIKILFNDKDKAEAYKGYLEDIFRKDAPGSNITIIISERKGETEEQWLKRAERELQREKSLHKENRQIITSGFFKACESCGLYPAEKEDRRPEGIRHICKSCHQKVAESKNYQNTEIYRELSKGRNGLDFPEDFNGIGKASDPEGYMGFIYADANRMGEHLAKIKTFDDLERFSKDVSSATLNATISAINNHFPNNFLPLQIILAGGDDLILALPAHKAIDVAIDFCENFNTAPSTHNITTSAAVVICHDSLPIKNVLSTAESLLKNAKAESRKKEDGTYIDFIVETGSALENPISKRKKEMEINDMGIHYITKRPYSIGEIKTLRDTIKDFKKKDFPKNKLKMLYGSLFKGHFQSILDACYIKTRLSEGHENLINNFRFTLFPWKEIGTNIYTTPFGDIAELYEFIH